MATLQQFHAWDQPVTPPSSAKPGTRLFGRYLFLVLLIPSILASSAFLVVNSKFYQRWSTSKWGPVLEYSFDTQPQNADVVIFGDSTAFIGIDPEILNAQLGIHSIVLPATIGSLPVIGDKTLQIYLAHNRPPRLLVLYFAPWNLDYRTNADIGLLEGEELLLRHGTSREIAGFARRHPAELIKFPFRFYSTFTPRRISAALRQPERYQATVAALGHVDYGESIPPLNSNCAIPAEFFARNKTSSIQNLVHHYTTATTKVFVYLAPVPDCPNSAELLHYSYPGLDTVPTKALPASFFAADPYYAHIRPKAVPVATTWLAQALQDHLR